MFCFVSFCLGDLFIWDLIIRNNDRLAATEMNHDHQVYHLTLDIKYGFPTPTPMVSLQPYLSNQLVGFEKETPLSANKHLKFTKTTTFIITRGRSSEKTSFFRRKDLARIVVLENTHNGIAVSEKGILGSDGSRLIFQRPMSSYPFCTSTPSPNRLKREP